MATTNSLRKQTLLGIAPVLPTSAKAAPEPEPVAAPEPPPPAPITAEVETARAPLVVPAASDNPLRKQTLLGIAPVLPEPPPQASSDSVSSIVTPAVAATDAPTTLEVEAPAAAKPVISWPPPQPTSDEDDDDFTPKPKRARWLLPLGIAAALGLGVVGWQQLRSTPGSAPPPPAPAAKAPPVAPPPVEAKPKSDDDLGPSTGEDSPPDTRTPEPQPLASAELAPSAAPAMSAAPSGDVVRIQVNSDPPGARLFWKGKSVGTTPFVLELAPGEKHAYEMGLPGYNTRKVVIDGSKTEISVGLKPEAGTFIGGNRRKP